MEWWILVRDEELAIKPVNDGNDPLYGEDSWNLFLDKPFSTREDAELGVAMIFQLGNLIKEYIQSLSPVKYTMSKEKFAKRIVEKGGIRKWLESLEVEDE